MIQKVHHVGIAVRDLEAALRFYRDLLGLHVHQQAVVEEQGVKAALLTVGESEIELLEPTGPDTPVGRFLARRGEGLHHLCFQTDDVARELEALKAKGVELVDREPRRGLAGLVCFLHPRAHHGVLVELTQPRD
ncbi:MAG: methylmalonyl-CoA epimerase [Dehalococcoidia bacterium]|nr:methylmalonyl-CoA epimerase [Dehalococcoidia bacterium]MDW8009111.1 methylmalonyl-CoA epimerase [Chloroflexota bacterium]